MGRSQVKFRTTHGRGGHGGRGSGSGSGDGVTHRSSSGRRPLESNAFRYAEDGAEERVDEAEAVSESSTQSFRRQFFAGEDDVRGPSARPSGSYFQSQAVKQWDEDEDEDERGDLSATRSGVLDLDWLGEQLAQVSPSIRYRMDPKYCVDFEYVAREQSDTLREQEDASVTQATQAAVPTDATATVAVRQSARPPRTADSELDVLLQLSASASSTSARPSSTTPVVRAAVAGAATTDRDSGTLTQPVVALLDASEHLEDWLDDVLDM